MAFAFCLLGFSAFISASPVYHVARRGTAPRATIANGTVIGTSSSGVESFLGIPYAQPPTGQLRLRPPQSLSTGFGTFTSQSTPNVCPQMYSEFEGGDLPQDVIGYITNSPLFQQLGHESEDCLNLNVQRPEGTTAASKLPVALWIFGGAFEIGSPAMFDGARIVRQSTALKQPVLFVAINYRLNGFGFLPGREVAADGSSNLGLRDQRLAMQWVQENIAAFGGDPTKVTLWGESAGAISICDHTLINGGDISYNGGQLFRGAIMNSGSLVPAVPVSHPKAQAVYDSVAQAGGCLTASDSLQCLRNLPYQDFRDAVASVPSFFSYQSVDLAYLPRPDPSDSFFPISPEVPIKSGDFAKIPVIIGDQADEGTLFSLTQANISTNQQLIDYVSSSTPLASPDVVAAFVNTYPTSPSAGSPYNTGLLNEWYPQFKRLASLLGDLSFTLQRRVYLDAITTHVTAYSYLATYLTAIPILGTFHASDIATEVGLIPLATLDTILQYYISFVSTGDPNAIMPKVAWGKYGADRQMLEYKQLSIGHIKDDFRGASYAYLKAHQEELRV